MPELAVIETPDTSEVENETHIMVGRASALVIDSPESLGLGAEFLRDLRTAKLKIKAVFDPARMSADKAHKQIVAASRKVTEPIARAESLVKGKIGAYRVQVEAERRAEEQRLAAVARKQDEERRLAEAERLEADGRKEEAEAVIEAPAMPVPMPVLPDTTPKTEGVSVRKVWKYQIADPMALPRQWLIADEKAIGEHARSMKERASIPGVRFWSEESVAVSGKD